MSTVLSCDACGARYRLAPALFRGERRIRIRCRKCGAAIDVLNLKMPPGITTGEGNPLQHQVNPSSCQADKAANNHSDRGSEKEAATEISVVEEHIPAAADEGNEGRVSPEYVASRAVDLDPDLLARNRCVVFDPESQDAEFYRILRTRILHRTEGIKGVTVMVTSAVPGEGKTTTAINLAFTFARSYGHTVLLVDADLKQQRIREILDFENDKGLADYLMDTFPLSDAIVWPGFEKLTILSGGKTVTDSSELLGSPRMKSLVGEMKSRYPERYVFFDVAPVLVGADALVFAPLVDCILFVVQAGRTSMQDVNRAIKMLPREKILGLVLNRDPHATMTDYYRYKYK